MGKSDYFEVEGIVKEALPNTTFRVMLDNGYETIVAGSPVFKGTGHNAELVTDDAGKTWMLYHAYSVAAPDKGRLLMLDEVRWDNDGWPYVSEGRPSDTAVPGPVWNP